MLTLPVLTFLFSERGAPTRPANTHTQLSNPETLEPSVLLLLSSHPVLQTGPAAGRACPGRSVGAASLGSAPGPRH